MLKIKTAVLNAMEMMAKELGINGVAVFHVREYESVDAISFSRTVGRMERDPDPARGENDTGTNYFGVVFTKIGEMLSTHMASGHADRPLKKGEFGWRGGALKEDSDFELYFAFSGGTEEQDVMVAEAGMSVVMEGMRIGDLGAEHIVYTDHIGIGLPNTDAVYALCRTLLARGAELLPRSDENLPKFFLRLNPGDTLLLEIFVEPGNMSAHIDYTVRDLQGVRAVHGASVIDYGIPGMLFVDIQDMPADIRSLLQLAFAER